MAKKIIGTCQLCLEEKELQKKCHILPRFFQRTLMEEGEFGTAIIENGNWKKVQDHFFGMYTYCYDCENKIFNKYGEDPISNKYRICANPTFENEYTIMHLGVSIMFRCAKHFQILYPLKDLSAAIRFWRDWLLDSGEPKPLLVRVGVLTYDRNGTMDKWQKNAKEIMFFDEAEYKGLNLLVANVPGMVFIGLVGRNDEFVNPNFYFDSDTDFATMVTSIINSKVIEILSDIPEQKPPWMNC